VVYCALVEVAYGYAVGGSFCFVGFCSCFVIFSRSFLALVTEAFSSFWLILFFFSRCGFLPSFFHVACVLPFRDSVYICTMGKFPVANFSTARLSSISRSKVSCFWFFSWFIWLFSSSISWLCLLYCVSSLSVSRVVLCSRGLNVMKYALPLLYSAFSSIPVPIAVLITDFTNWSPYLVLILSRSPSSFVRSCICVAMLAFIDPMKSDRTCDISIMPIPHFLHSRAARSSCMSPSPVPPNLFSRRWTSS